MGTMAADAFFFWGGGHENVKEKRGKKTES
jgi:hypothetical protein